MAAALLLSALPRHAMAQSSLAPLITQLFPALRDSVSADQWIRAHPDAAQHIVRGGKGVNACMVTTTPVPLADGDIAHVEVTFDTPAPPRVLQLPAASPELVRQCRAAMIWVTLPDHDSITNDRLRQRTTDALSPVLGAGKPAGEVDWGGSALWVRPIMRDTAGVTTIISARTHVFAFMFATRLGYVMNTATWASPSEPEEFSDTPAQVTRADIGRMMRAAELPPDLASQLEQFRGIFEPDTGEPRHLTAAERDAFASALTRLIAISTTWSGPRRAADLLTADGLLDEAAPGSGWREYSDSLYRRRFEALGAKFLDDHIGFEMVYDQTWLLQAWRLSPRSPAGETAFITLLRRGFVTNPTCQSPLATGDSAVRVEAMRFIVTHPASPMLPEVHVLLGRAWGDILALATGQAEDDDSTEMASFASQAAPARAHAIAEYRTALATLHDGALRTKVWREGWRLAAGLAPVGIRFGCFED